MKMICSNCGTSFEDGSMFCNKCGSKLSAEAPVETTPSEVYTAPYTPEETTHAQTHFSAEPSSQKQSEVIDSNVNQKGKRKKKTGIVIGIIGAVVLIPIILLIVLIIALSGGDDDTNTDTTNAPSTEATQTVTQLSNNKFDFNIKLNGVVYSLPASVIDFESNGWIIDEDNKTAILEPTEEIDISAQNDTGYITLHIYNDGDSAKAVNECQVGGVTISFNRSNTYTVELSNELSLSKDSALTDIVFLWGEYTYVERLQYFYEYAKTIRNSCAYIFETDTDGNLLSVTIKNYDTDNLYNTGTSMQGVSVEIATPVNALSNNLADGVVSFDGIPVALPAKVGDVISAGGWQLVIGSTKVAPHELTTIVLTKNLRKFGFDNLVTLQIINTTDNEISYEDATITGISYDSAYETTYPILEFANGITLGMTEADFLNAASNFEFTSETSGETTYYRTPVTEDGFEYTFIFREDKTLESMDISCQYVITDYDAILS